MVVVSDLLAFLHYQKKHSNILQAILHTLSFLLTSTITSTRFDLFTPYIGSLCFYSQCGDKESKAVMVKPLTGFLDGFTTPALMTHNPSMHLGKR